MQYVIEFRRVGSDANGNLRASAEVFCFSSRDSTTVSGEGCFRLECFGSVVAVQGFGGEVWDVVQRVQASGLCGVIDRHPALPRVPRLGCATISPADLERDCFEGVFPSVIMPHLLVARVQNRHAAKC